MVLLRRLLPVFVSLAVAGCTVGPDFAAPKKDAPRDWTSWHSGEPDLVTPVDTRQPLDPQWWKVLGDPVLDELETRAGAANTDLQKAVLHLAQSRQQRAGVIAQRAPSVNASASETRQRMSESGASTRIVQGLGATGSQGQLIDLLSQPYNLYQAGVDASWELDLWGRVRRSVEAADADLAQQASMLDATRLSVAGDVARTYAQLRVAQRQLKLTRDDIDAMAQRLQLIQVRVDAGTLDHVNLEQQRAELAGLRAQVPEAVAQAAAYENQLCLLLGEHPGALHGLLQSVPADGWTLPPDLTAGVPSELTTRRPDIRAAEQRLRSATAQIGVAKADLYPRVTLGAKGGVESLLDSQFTDWGSRTWSIGPSLSLPIFDHGRRVSVVKLRELQQQEAAVDFHHTVLQAWQDVDNALTGYDAERTRTAELQARVASAREADALIRVKYDAGTIDFLSVLDSQRTYLQARRDLVAAQGQVVIRYASVNTALGNITPNKP